MRPTLSIVIPTLGRSTLADTLDSIAAQGLVPGDQVIVVRDSYADPDDTRKVEALVASYGTPFIYLEYDAGSHGYGGTAQANHGLRHVSGDYVLVLGDDDVYVAGAFDKIRAAVQPDRVLICKVFLPWREILPIGHTVERDRINGAGIVVPRAFVQDFPMTGEPDADFDWMTQVIASAMQEPAWLDEVVVIANPERRAGVLTTQAPHDCASCKRGIFAEDAVGGLCVICRTPKPTRAPVQVSGTGKKIVFVWPAAEISVSDVAKGYHAALQRRGHTLIDFKLNNRFKYHAAAITAIQHLKPTDDINLDLLSREVTEGIAAFVLRHQPDLVIIVAGMAFHPDGLYYLRKLGVPVITVFTESPYNDAQQQSFHAVYPEMACTTNDARSARVHGWFHLPPSFDQDIHQPVSPSEEFTCDVFMVATGWPERQALLERVDWTGIDLRLYGYWPTVTYKSQLFRYVRWMHSGSVMVDNNAVGHAYCSARISLNVHREDKEGHSVNPRCLEVAACGGFLLTDYRRGLEEMFGGAYVPTFDNAVNLEGQIRYWLAHDAERRIVAEELRRAVRNETFDARVTALTPFIEQVESLMAQEA